MGRRLRFLERRLGGVRSPLVSRRFTVVLRLLVLAAAVVAFAAPANGVAPLSLPSAGVLDGKAPDSVVVVGYGADQPAADKHNPSFTFDFTRRWGVSDVQGTSKTELRTSLRDGGVCHGDSGGPELLGSTIVAVTS